MPIASCGFADDPGQPGSGAVNLVHIGPTLLVRVGFDPGWDPNRVADANLPTDPRPALVDTGATTSSIDARLASTLALPLVGQQELGGISGSYTAPSHLAQVFVPILQVTIHGLFTAVNLASGGQPHEVLLGRTFLRNFRMIYEGRTGSVILENESHSGSG